MKVLNNAIEDGGTSLRDHVPNGELGYFLRAFGLWSHWFALCFMSNNDQKFNPVGKVEFLLSYASVRFILI